MRVLLMRNQDDVKKVLTIIKRVLAWMGKQTSFPSFYASNNHLNHQH